MDDIKVSINSLVKKVVNEKTSKVPIQVLVDTLYYRLAIIRLGEEDNNSWWESVILSDVGRRNLEKFLPNTFWKQRYAIARNIVADKEDRLINDKTKTTLFNFGSEFEKEIFEPFIKEVSLNDEWQTILRSFESIKGKRFNSSWSREYFGMHKLPAFARTSESIVNLGSLPGNFYKDIRKFDETMKFFISVYDTSRTGNVVLPYYKRMVAI